MNIKDLEAKVTNQVIASLEAGVPPWHQQWVKDGSTNALLMSHHNGETGHTYTGINWLITQFSEYNQMIGTLREARSKQLALTNLFLMKSLRMVQQ